MRNKIARLVVGTASASFQVTDSCWLKIPPRCGPLYRVHVVRPHHIGQRSPAGVNIVLFDNLSEWAAASCDPKHRGVVTSVDPRSYCKYEADHNF